MRFYVHGARGSSGVSGPAFARYGGYTTCLATTFPDGRHLIIDAGSGLLRLGAALAAMPVTRPFEATLLLTHLHWDHIQGLPFFAPLREPTTKLHILAAPPPGLTVEEAIDGAFRPPWFPVQLATLPGRVTFAALPTGPFEVGPVRVSSAALHHPGGVTGYRIEKDGRALVFATDVEAGDPSGDAALRALATGATVLVHDAQYLPDEWVGTRSGWGHSTWEHATALARAAGVERLLLTSHDPERSDDAVDTIVRAARERFTATDAAAEGQVLEV